MKHVRWLASFVCYWLARALPLQSTGHESSFLYPVFARLMTWSLQIDGSVVMKVLKRTGKSGGTVE